MVFTVASSQYQTFIAVISAEEHMEHDHKETPIVSIAPSSIKGGKTPVVSTETDVIVEAVLRRFASRPTLAGGSGSLVNVIRSRNAFSSLITI